MAAKGNPSTLHFVFANVEFGTPWRVKGLKKKDIFGSSTHLKPFLEFADDHTERVCCRKGQKSVRCGELEERDGYPRKYAMHVIRLHLESKDYTESGKFILPSPKFDLLEVLREGKPTRAEIEDMGKQFEVDAVSAQSKSPLPGKGDWEALTMLIPGGYRDYWRAQKRCQVLIRDSAGFSILRRACKDQTGCRKKTGRPLQSWAPCGGRRWRASLFLPLPASRQYSPRGMRRRARAKISSRGGNHSTSKSSKQ